jgi:hypothetical protein
MNRNDFKGDSLLKTVQGKDRSATSSRYPYRHAGAYEDEHPPIALQEAEEDINRPPDSDDDEEHIPARYDSSDDDTNPADILPSLGTRNDAPRSMHVPATKSKPHTQTSPISRPSRRRGNPASGTPKHVKVGKQVSGSQEVDIFGRLPQKTSKRTAMKYGSSQKGYSSSQGSKRSITDEQSTGDSSPKAIFKPPPGKLSSISWQRPKLTKKQLSQRLQSHPQKSSDLAITPSPILQRSLNKKLQGPSLHTI